ncbi:hypothetical protein D3C77_475060 [compost metagenome]
MRGVAGEQAEQQQRQYQGDHGKAEYIVPAKACGQHGRKQGGEHCAGIACTGNAHGLALVLGRVPLRGQRQRDGKRGAGHTQEYAQQQRLLIAVDAQVPGAEQRHDDNHLANQAGGLGRQAIHQHPHDKAQDGPRQDRRGHHQAALLGGQLQVGGDLHRQRAQQVPDHETQVEIQKGGEQRGDMPGLPETRIHRTPR